MPQGFICITSRPKGEAPEEIRDEWIGLVLSCNLKTDDPVVGAVTGKLAWFGGYEVSWTVAMNELGIKSPEARRWWEKLREQSTLNFSVLVFDKDCCEVLPD
ncbi:MAG: hypothetical protein HY507_01580 [Candidatus Zambryskibacteria bacterium]|nr:hypothetical protein [Candidatus Zambryskibacteria bacterium]